MTNESASALPAESQPKITSITEKIIVFSLVMYALFAPHSIAITQGSFLLGLTAWAVQTGYTTAQGVNSVAAIDCVWLNRSRPDLLTGLATTVARISPAAAVVNAPSLAGFDSKLLRQAGFRQVGPGFHGYCATVSGAAPLPRAAAINCEIV